MQDGVLTTTMPRVVKDVIEGGGVPAIAVADQEPDLVKRAHPGPMVGLRACWANRCPMRCAVITRRVATGARRCPQTSGGYRSTPNLVVSSRLHARSRRYASVPSGTQFHSASRRSSSSSVRNACHATSMACGLTGDSQRIS